MKKVSYSLIGLVIAFGTISEAVPLMGSPSNSLPVLEAPSSVLNSIANDEAEFAKNNSDWITLHGAPSITLEDWETRVQELTSASITGFQHATATNSSTTQPHAAETNSSTKTFTLVVPDEKVVAWANESPIATMVYTTSYLKPGASVGYTSATPYVSESIVVPTATAPPSSEQYPAQNPENPVESNTAAPPTEQSPEPEKPDPNAITNIPLDGLVYSPYRDDRSCKSEQEMRLDLEKIATKSVKSLRLYATDCNSLNTVVPTAIAMGFEIDQGFWIDQRGPGSADGQLDQLIQYGTANGWSGIRSVLVGNEAILSGYTTPTELLAKIEESKGKLRAAGYYGNVSTAEPPVIYFRYPELCNNDVTDYVAINSHVYFDPSKSAQQAGVFVATEAEQIGHLCPGKHVYVAETGYPSAGNVNGGNVPSPENQALAIKGILESMNGYATFLTMYNDYWKDPGPYAIEQHFGIFNII